MRGRRRPEQQGGAVAVSDGASGPYLDFIARLRVVRARAAAAPRRVQGAAASIVSRRLFPTLGNALNATPQSEEIDCHESGWLRIAPTGGKATDSRGLVAGTACERRGGFQARLRVPHLKGAFSFSTEEPTLLPRKADHSRERCAPRGHNADRHFFLPAFLTQPSLRGVR